MATKGAILVKVDLLGVPEVAAAADKFRDSLVKQVMKSGATKGARRTKPPVKANLKFHKRTGQLERAQDVKFKSYSGAWVVMLGARKYFRGSAPSWMSPNRTTIDPVKYDHLLEGGRGHTTIPKSAFSMPIFVRKLDPRRRKRFKGTGSIPWRHARRFSKDRMTQYGYRKTLHNGRVKTIQDRARRVPGGWLLFTMFARPAPPAPFLIKESSTYGSNIKTCVTQEVKTALPLLAARYAARGRSPYKP